MTRAADLAAALRDLPGQERAWIESDDIAAFAFYGWGIALNSAQEEALNDVFFNKPAGTAHIWRWANRTGKTTALMVGHSFAVWKKWRYRNEGFTDWLAYLYRTLHAAPLNRLMGKAWEIADAMSKGVAPQQRSPITNRQRPAPLSRLFTAGSGTAPDGSDILFWKCANGGQVDFLSTHDGAARMESEAWWLVGWDEFPRQVPSDQIPTLIDQTFLPRTSDYTAPLIFSGTVTEASEWAYMELEERAAENPKWWHLSTAARAVNFSQTRESIDRQTSMSMNREIALRSVEGGFGGGSAELFPDFVLDNAFTDDLPERSPFLDHPNYAYMTTFDHALQGDDNVTTTFRVPWPLIDLSPENPIIGVHQSIMRSHRALLPTEHQAMLEREDESYHPFVLVVDGTAEGGISVYRTARAAGLPVASCNYAARHEKFVSNKEYSLQATQKLFGWGLPWIEGDDGMLLMGPQPEGAFGALKLPASWRKLRAQLRMLRREDQHLRQDAAMTVTMAAWYIVKAVGSGEVARPQPFRISARRR